MSEPSEERSGTRPALEIRVGELKQLFNAMDPAPFRADQKFSVCALVALVVGSMVGAGIYALPSAFSRATGGLRALTAWPSPASACSCIHGLATGSISV